MPRAADHQVGTGTRLIYGAGAMAFGVKDHGFSYFLLIFYNQVMGLPAAKVGLAIMIALVADAVMDPAIGHASDNLRSRWGRRHPFMYAAALPVGLSYLLLWNPPRGWGEDALFAYLVALAILIRGCINTYEVPSAAMAAELSSDYDERTRLFSYRYLFGWFGGLIMYFSSLWFFLRPDEAHPVGQLNPEGYVRYGLAAAALMVAAILVSAIGTHKYIPGFRQAPERKPTLRTLWRETSSLFSDRSFLMLLGGSLFNAMGFSLWLSSALYFQTFFWELTPREIALFAASGAVAAVLAFGIAPLISRRTGKKAAAIAFIALAAALALTPIVLRLADAFPPNGSPALMPLLLAQNTVSNCLSIGVSILVVSMVADVVEEAELRTGRRQEGLIFAAHSFVVTSVAGLGIFLSGAIVSAIGLSPGAKPGDVAPEVARSLGLVFIPTLAALSATAAAALTGYRISRRAHEASLEKLGVARSAKG